MYQVAGDLAIFKGTTVSGISKIYMTNPITSKKSWARRVTVKNTGATNVLRVYVPTQADYLTVEINGGVISFDGPISWVAVVAAASTTTYEVHANLA